MVGRRGSRAPPRARPGTSGPSPGPRSSPGRGASSHARPGRRLRRRRPERRDLRGLAGRRRGRRPPAPAALPAVGDRRGAVNHPACDSSPRLRRAGRPVPLRTLGGGRRRAVTGRDRRRGAGDLDGPRVAVEPPIGERSDRVVDRVAGRRRREVHHPDAGSAEELQHAPVELRRVVGKRVEVRRSRRPATRVGGGARAPRRPPAAWRGPAPAARGPSLRHRAPRLRPAPGASPPAATKMAGRSGRRPITPPRHSPPRGGRDRRAAHDGHRMMRACHGSSARGS